MASLDDNISKIDAQLLEVGPEIRDCELASAAADEVSDRGYYRDKEKQLRDTEKKLRDAQKQLRDEKKQYLKKQLGEEAKKQTGIVKPRHLNVLGTVRRCPAHLPQTKSEVDFYIAPGPKIKSRLGRAWGSKIDIEAPKMEVDVERINFSAAEGGQFYFLSIFLMIFFRQRDFR